MGWTEAAVGSSEMVGFSRRRSVTLNVIGKRAMPTPYDDAVEIQLEFDGRILRGRCQIWNYPARRELRVYYNGHSEAATIGDDTAEKQPAMELFQRIVSRHYTLMSRVAPALPQAIRQAAFRYVNDIEDNLPNDADYLLSHALVEAFGDQPVGSLAHRRVSWPCLNALKCVVPAWAASCDDPTAERTFVQLVRHLRDGVAIEGWDVLCQPPTATREGRRIVDCVACMVKPIATGVANAAKYLWCGDPRAAGDVIQNAWCAQDEGAWRNKSLSFQQWVVLVGLPAAHDCREVNSASISAEHEICDN
jgi:hypothetical protein